MGGNRIVGDTEDLKHQRGEGPVSCSLYLPPAPSEILK